MKTKTFSQQEINQIIERAFDNKNVKVLDYNLKRYSEDRLGFLGNHQSLELTIIRKNGSDDPEVHRFFAKGLPLVPNEKIPFVRSMFVQEASYFNDILPLLKKYCPSTEDWSPRCLLASNDFIVLEDLRLCGYAMSNSNIITAEQLHAAFRAQARLHAASLVAVKQLGKTWTEAHPKGCREMIFTNEKLLQCKRLESTIELAEKVAKRLALDGKRLSAGLHKGFYQMYNQSNLKTKLPKVFGHGDARLNNYLFGTTDRSKCMLVDFQLSRYGPPTFDLTLFIYLSTTRDFREKEVRKAIEVYHEQLCEVLEKNDPEIRKPTLDEIIDEYEELKATAFYCSAVYYPFICVDDSTLAKYDEQEIYERLVFKGDISLIMQLYDEDGLFAARMNEVIEEAIQYFEKRRVQIETEK